jgi:hypothetical protein
MKKHYVMIPAAGSSARFLELGRHYAKCVLPFDGKPIIAHIIERLGDKWDGFYIIVNNDTHKEQIENAIATLKNRSKIQVCVIDESTSDLPRGPGKTIHLGKQFIQDEDYALLVHLSDSLFQSEHLANIKPDEFSVTWVADTTRWCVYSEQGRYLNKESIPDGGYALTGLYYFSEPPKTPYPPTEGETQISHILMRHNWRKVTCPIDLDFGTIEEYNTHRGISKTRSFNTINDYGKYIIKTSTDVTRLSGEYLWYDSLPVELAPYAAHMYRGSSPHGLILERLNGTNLRDLCLYIDRSYETWSVIFKEVSRFLIALSQDRVYHTATPFMSEMYMKTLHRVRTAGLDNPMIDTFLSKFEEVCNRSGQEGEQCRIHGDLHFANMFFDFHYKQLKVIDPRGDLYGCQLYDIAKLYHSVYGNYDWIDGELYTTDPLTFYDKGREGIQKAFNDHIFSFFPDDVQADVKTIAASLFLSMIPLHTHNPINQQLFLKEFERLAV